MPPIDQNSWVEVNMFDAEITIAKMLHKHNIWNTNFMFD